MGPTNSDHHVGLDDRPYTSCRGRDVSCNGRTHHAKTYISSERPKQ